MKSTIVIGFLAAMASAADMCEEKPLVNSEELQGSIKEADLLAGAEALQGFAYAHPERSRVMGSAGHQDTVDWLVNELSALDGYYTVETQEFQDWVQLSGKASFFVNGAPANASLMDFSASGNVTAELVPINNLGCTAADYPAEVEGKIALVSRGTCELGLKSALAGSAGAIGALIYNNVPGPLLGSLSTPGRPEGDYVPTLSLTQEQGNQFVEQINGGATISVTLDVVTRIEYATTFNVVATSNCGNKNTTLLVGAHTDSVAAGPGINDNGSGVVGILEVAKALSKYKVNNAVSFGFWSGEEINLLGARHYVETASADKIASIRAYLNFDTIASPNYVHATYDGDGSDFSQVGPAGSAEIEQFYHKWFASVGQNSTTTPFYGQSDQLAFIDSGIPAGGTFTGVAEIKTEEEAQQFGGEAGVAMDVNYHQAGDTVDNLSMEAFLVHTQAIAASVAEYGTSFDSLPPKETPATKRSAGRRSEVSHGHEHSSGCGHVVI